MLDASTLFREAKRVTPWTSLFLVAVVLVAVSGIYARTMHLVPALRFVDVLEWQLAAWAPWLLVLPLVVAGVRATRSAGVSAMLVHLSGSLVLAAAMTLWFQHLSVGLSPFLDAPDTRYGVYRWFFVFWAALQALFYWGALGLSSLTRSEHRSDERDLAQMAPSSTRRRLLVRSGEATDVVKIEDIAWIEAQDYYSVLHVGESVYWIKKSLDVLEKDLASGAFVRIHRSSLINLDHLKRIQIEDGSSRTAVLDDGARRKISRQRWPELKRRFDSASDRS